MSCCPHKMSRHGLNCTASAAGSSDQVADALLCAFCAQKKKTRPDLHQTLCCLLTQGAVAVEGEAHLWRPGRGGPPLPTSASHTGHSASDAAAQLAAEGQVELDSMDAGAAGIRDEARPGAQAEGDGTGAVSAAGEHWWLPLQAGQALACWLPLRVGLLRWPAAPSFLGALVKDSGWLDLDSRPIGTVLVRCPHNCRGTAACACLES